MTSGERVALVTGAARGIGAATVRHLSDDGYHVLALDICSGDEITSMPGVGYALGTREELDAVVTHSPSQITPIICDVRDRGSLETEVDRAVARLGRLDVAVAAAAVISGGTPQWETPEDEIRLLLEVDLMGVWNTASVCVPHLLHGPAPHDGRFVAIASAAGQQGLFRLTGYCAAKHAVIGLVKGLAADLVGTGVTAVAVSPGSTMTAMLRATADIYELDGVEDLASKQLVQRTLTPEEIAATVAFCCSSAGAALNGSVISATGGFQG